MASVSSITPRLAPGILSIYGTASIYGFSRSDNLAFGVIYQMSSVNSGAYSVGQNVLIPYNKDDLNSIGYGGQTYWLVEEAKIILVEVENIS